MKKSIQNLFASLAVFFLSSGLAVIAQPVTAALQASASKQVLQDEIKLVFAQDAAGKTAPEVNRILADALEQGKASLKGMSGFNVSSGSFRTFQSYNKEGRPDGWRGRAELVLTSTDFAAAQSAAGVLGTQLALSSVQFSLSSSLRRKEEQALLQEVAQAFRARAQVAASAFGYSNYKINSLDFNGLGAVQAPLLMRSAAPMSAPAAEAIKFSFEPGLVQVTVDVTGKVTFD